MKLDLPVMVAALLVAATLQELLPPVPLGGLDLKVQLLPAIALYYLERRPWPMALCAALWAGILTDSLGGLPGGLSAFTLLCAGGVVLLVRDASERRSPLRACLPGAILAFVMGVAQGARLALSPASAPFLSSVAAALKLMPLGALAAIAADAALGRIDFLAGNVEPIREEGIT